MIKICKSCQDDARVISALKEAFNPLERSLILHLISTALSNMGSETLNNLRTETPIDEILPKFFISLENEEILELNKKFTPIALGEITCNECQSVVFDGSIDKNRQYNRIASVGRKK